MDLENIIGQLHQQLAGVNATISALEAVVAGGKPKRGRPPGSKSAVPGAKKKPSAPKPK